MEIVTIGTIYSDFHDNRRRVSSLEKGGYQLEATNKTGPAAWVL